jgi:hypothetical protein
MRGWFKATVTVAALAVAPAAAGGGPGSVYSDYATDRALSCNHSRADLRAALSDASLNQYGDPYTMVGLKLAVRKQLAGGCRRRGRKPLYEPPAAGVAPRIGTSAGPGATGRQKPRNSQTRQRHASSTAAPLEHAESQGQDRGMLLLGAGLLLLTLGTGGWAARRALSGRP